MGSYVSTRSSVSHHVTQSTHEIIHCAAATERSVSMHHSASLSAPFEVFIVTLPFEGLCRAFSFTKRLRYSKIFIRTPENQYFFHLETIPPCGTIVLQKEQGWCPSELRFVQTHASLAYVGVTHLTIQEIAQRAEDLVEQVRNHNTPKFNSKVFAKTFAQQIVVQHPVDAIGTTDRYEDKEMQA